MHTPTPSIHDHPAAAAALSRAEILYTDLDGTLFGRGGSALVDAHGDPSLETARAVVALNSAGLPIVPVTGRNRLQLDEITRVLDWSHGYIGELGCVVVRGRGGRSVYDTGDWPPDALRPDETPYQAIERVGAYRMLLDAFPGRVEHHAPHHLNREATFVLRGHIDATRVRDELASLELPVALIDNGIIHPPRTTLVGVTEVHAYHLAPAGASKARAVAEDLARRGIERSAALAIGDSATDVEMADAVDLLVLVGNALDDPRVVDAVADRTNVAVTRGSRGEGWAELADAWLARDGLAR